jgi:glycosyltransferase involved in cell wall biosynthesis
VEVADSEREPVVIVVAQLRPEKSTDVAVRAFAKARLAESGWRLEIVGDGPRRQSLEQLAGELALTESCRFRGSSEDVRSHLRRAAIMLAPASGEPFGLAVVEAMASAVPVVAAGSGGHMETVGVCAEPVLFSPGDVAEAARQLRHLAEDPARRRQYGRRLQALQRERFSSDRQIDETLACYEELVARV